MNAPDSSKRKRWILIACAAIVVVFLAAIASAFLIDVNSFARCSNRGRLRRWAEQLS